MAGCTEEIFKRIRKAIGIYINIRINGIMIMKKIVVTGAGGYIGRHVVSTLLDMGHDVVAVDINTELIDERAKTVNLSIFEDNKNLFNLLGEPDVCVHLAWRNGFVHNADTHIGDLSAHFMFIKNMIDAGLKNIAIMGTMHEVGYWEGAIDEDTPCNPLSQYGIAKNALRQAVFQFSEGKDVNVYWLRAYYILGDDTKNHSIFTKILKADKNEQEFFPFTTGKTLYDFISVDELSKQIACTVSQDEITGVINVCTGRPISLAERTEQFINEHNLSIKLKYGAYPDRPYDSPGTWGNPDKINEIMSKK